MAISIRRRGDTSTVSVTVRFDSRLHFGLELLARIQHRSLNSLIEWGIVRLINDPVHGLDTKILDEVWDHVEADRIVKLAQKYPSLLGPNWDRVWKAIRENKSLWINSQTPDIKKIRAEWDSLREKHLFRK